MSGSSKQAPVSSELNPRVQTAWLVGLSVLAIATVAVLLRLLVVFPRAAWEPCAGVEQQLEGVWDPATRDALEQVWADSSLPGAQAAFAAIAASLDDQREAWIATYTGACTRTMVDQTQSKELGGLQRVCLEERRFEMSAVAGALNEPSRDVIAGRAGLGAVLEPLSICENVGVLEAAPTPERSILEDVQAVRHQLAELEVRGGLGIDDELRADAQELFLEAEALGFQPLTTRVVRFQVSLGPQP